MKPRHQRMIAIAAGVVLVAVAAALVLNAFQGNVVFFFSPSQVASGEAPVGLNSTGNASFCIIWTTTHVPAISVPAFTGPNGLPVGLQVIAAPHADRALFEAARWVMRHIR